MDEQRSSYSRGGMDGPEIFRWIMVLPMFLFSFIFLRVFFRILVELMIINVIVGRNLQLKFVLHHLYVDLICVIVAIIFSCLTAPKFQTRISLMYFILVLVSIPIQLEGVARLGMYGDHPWKVPYLITLYVLSGLIPFLYFLIKRIASVKENSIE